MRKLALFIAVAFVCSTSFAQTANEVIDKFVTASGGKGKLQAINTLQYTQVVKMQTPMGALEIPMAFYKEKNKLFRMQASMQFGPQNLDFFTVINDTAGFVMLPANPLSGDEGGLKKMEEKDRVSQLYQMDPAGMFAGLIDYEAKGSKVALLKDEKVEKEDCYKIKFTNKAAQEVTYLISKATGLVVRQDTKGTMAANMSGFGSMMSSMGAGGKIDKLEVSILYNDYKDIEGIKFPTKLTIKTAMADSESELKDIKVNKQIDAKLYKAE
jgi:outer membrane lipoprotein-sorting protein